MEENIVFELKDVFVVYGVELIVYNVLMKFKKN